MPEKPTWQQVADLAAQVDGAQPGMKGICLRGQPGWGQVFAPLTTVVNTFGGTWFTEDWTGRGRTRRSSRRPPSSTSTWCATHGEAGAPQAGFTECLNNMTQGNVAMWYDATSAAGSLEADDSPVKGKIGYVAAPVVKTDELRLALRLGLGHPAGQREEGQRLEVHLLGVRARSTRSWSASSSAGRSVPAGKRASTYENPRVPAGGRRPSPSRPQAAIESADPRNPGVQPRPAPGIQFVGIPEFPDLGTQVSQEVSAAIAGQITVDEALERGPAAGRRRSREALPVRRERRVSQ